MSKPQPELRTTNALELAFSLLSDQSPVFFHQVDVGFGQARRNVNPAVGDAPIDLQFGDRPAIDQDEEQTAAPFDAKRVERKAAVFVEFKKRAVISFPSRIRIKGDYIAFGQ